MSRIAQFDVELAGASARTVTVGYITEPVAADPFTGHNQAVDGVDYAASAGEVTLQPGEVLQSVPVRVRDNDATQRQCWFALRLIARNGAVLKNSLAVQVIPGWVGILDAIGVSDGTTTPFVPGLIGVIDG